MAWIPGLTWMKDPKRSSVVVFTLAKPSSNTSSKVASTSELRT